MTTEERNKMVAENMGLVYSFVISLNVSPEYREDLIQEGAKDMEVVINYRDGGGFYIG